MDNEFVSRALLHFKSEFSIRHCEHIKNAIEFMPNKTLNDMRTEMRIWKQLCDRLDRNEMGVWCERAVLTCWGRRNLGMVRKLRQASWKYFKSLDFMLVHSKRYLLFENIHSALWPNLRTILTHRLSWGHFTSFFPFFSQFPFLFISFSIQLICKLERN